MMSHDSDDLRVNTGADDVNPTNVAVRDLRVRLTRNGREAEVLRGVDFTIGRGEIIGLVGESGSGKAFSATPCWDCCPSRPGRS